MPNRFENRRSLLLAVLLALLAAGTLCVWGAAAAGLSFSSPALEAAIQAFNETRARDTGADSSGGGDVDISLPGDGNGTPGGDTGDDDADTGDGGGSDDGGQAGGGGDGDARNCLLGILCLDLNAGINADVDADVDAAGGANGLNIGGLHIGANVDADDDLIADVDVNANGADQSRCFLNLICLTANADADLATNDGLDLNAVVDADVDVDDDIDADVDVDANVGSASGSQQGFLDGLLDLFINVN
jgi:hypothetical protein